MVQNAKWPCLEYPNRAKDKTAKMKQGKPANSNHQLLSVGLKTKGGGHDLKFESPKSHIDGLGKFEEKCPIRRHLKKFRSKPGLLTYMS
jgi:hypothetical protein